MTLRIINWGTCAALLVAQVAAPVLAQTGPVPPTPPSQGGPQIQPPRRGGPVAPTRPDGPQIQPPRPVVPVLPGRPGGPQIQPPRPVRPLPPVPPGGPQIQPPILPGRDFAGVIHCESRNNRYHACAIPRTDRVRLIRRFAGSCVQNRSWGHNLDRVWVSNGCRAEFGYGYVNAVYPQPQPAPDRNRGSSAGAVIAGVVVAGGLIALLAGRKKAQPTETAASASAGPTVYPAGPPATLSADLSGLPSAARSSVQNCMFDAARQIGVTGGTRLKFERSLSLEPGNGGWRLRASMTATYPDGDRALEMYCRSTPEKIVQLDFS